MQCSPCSLNNYLHELVQEMASLMLELDLWRYEKSFNFQKIIKFKMRAMKVAIIAKKIHKQLKRVMYFFRQCSLNTAKRSHCIIWIYRMWFLRRIFLNIVQYISLLNFEPRLGPQFKPGGLRFLQFNIITIYTNFWVNFGISDDVVLERKIFFSIFLRISMISFEPRLGPQF